MRNYVIINGVNSLDIQGLAINILPPITKPMIRTQIEEIDGRDGDLVTELGYSAYDKSMEIGLWGTYDIDAIIKYFTGDGTIVFSTEPDKYYYFKILNQIDYEKLLKFKKATVTFHCQPYKYPTSETPLEEAYEYVEATGTDLTLNNTEETIFNKFDLIGNTSQETTTGKNLFSGNYSQFDSTGGTGSTYGYFALPNDGETYTISVTAKNTFSATMSQYIGFTVDGGQASGGYVWVIVGGSTYTKGQTYTKTNFISNTRYGYVSIFSNNSATLETLVENFDIQLEKGSTATSFEPYTGGIPAPNPDFPEQVHVVSGDNEIEIYGKNLINVVEVNKGVNSSGVISGNDTHYLGIGEYVPCKPNTTYTITFEHDISTLTMYIGYKDQNGNFINRLASTSRTFTTPNNAYSMFVYVYKDDRFDSAGGYVQLEYGNTATPFEEYQSQTYPINLGAENIINYLDVKGVGSRDGTDNVISGKTSISDDVLTISQTYSQGGAILKYNTITPPSVKAGEYITISFIPTVSITGIVGISNYNGGGTNNISMNQSFTANTKYTVTLEALSDYPKLGVFIQGSSSTLSIKELMVERGKKVNSYTPYGEYIEMCSIPNTDYKDTFVHEDNKWYKRETIRKVILDGTENWGFRTDWQLPTASVFRNAGYVAGTFMNETNGYSNYFQVVKTVPSVTPNRYIRVTNTNGYGTQIFIENDFLGIESTDAAAQRTEKLKTWLAANNTSFYGVSPNPELIEITDETLKAQLDDLWENAISYKGQTNITQTNNDMPFILDVSALEDGSDHLIIDNIGTAYSKPTIDIEGTGIVDIYLNDEQIFEIDMTNENEIIIDTEKMEAYTPDNLLANRLVTGDYSNFKLAPGENDLRFSGDLTKATVTRYIRWI